MTTYLIFMLLISWRGNHLLTNALKLYFENLDLIEDLFDSNKKLKQAYEALEESKRGMSNIQEYAPIGMAIMSLDKKWIQVNQALCNSMGYSKAELENIKVQMITYPKDIAIEENYIKKLLKGKISSCQYEKRYIHKNGNLIWTLTNQSLMRDNEKKPMYFISQIEDITVRKLNEKKMEELAERTKYILDELHQREHDMTVITKMNDMLQTCNECNEAYTIIQFFAHELFHNINGNLNIYNQSLNTLKLVSVWGGEQLLNDQFSLEDCWALREGHAYIIDDSTKKIICKHFKKISGSSVCFPLIVKNEIIGMLNLNATDKNAISDYQKNLISTFGDVIKLSLANIKLLKHCKNRLFMIP